MPLVEERRLVAVPARAHAAPRTGSRPALIHEEQDAGLTGAALDAAQRAGPHHLAFGVESAGELRAIEERLRKAGTRLLHDGIVAHREGASSAAVFFEDPDGTRLEVFAQGIADAPAPSGDAPA